MGSIVSTKAKWTPSKRCGVGDRRKRRRSWPVAEKRRIVAETLVPGASVSVVARRHEVNANQVLEWRRELAAADPVALPGPACEFVPIGVFAEVEGKARAAAQGNEARPAAPTSSQRADGDRLALWQPSAGGCVGRRAGAGSGSPGTAASRMIQVAPGTKVHLALRPLSMRYGFDGLGAKVVGGAARRSVLGASLHLPQQARRLFEDPLLGRLGPVPVCQAAGAGALCPSAACWPRLFQRSDRRPPGLRWPPIVDGSLQLTPAQLALLIEAIDWRRTVAPALPAVPKAV
jgi:transposase